MSEWVLGHEPLTKRINVRNELRRYSKDPMRAFLDRIEPERFTLVQSAAVRYEESYHCFYLALRRYLPEMSLAIRWSNGPRWALRYREKYTPAERKLADRYNEIAPYIHLDFYTCLLWARIVLDRTVALSRYFIDEPELPSFTSFNQHRKFFVRRSTEPYGSHEAYARYFRDETAWFDEPLKLARDKFVVHAAPAHGKAFGFPGLGHELGLAVFIAENPAKPLEKVKVMHVGIPQLADEIYRFLQWYADYADSALSSGADAAVEQALRADGQAR